MSDLDELFGRLVEADAFVEPWMRLLNPDLLVRYWRKKGSPGTLRFVNRWGYEETRYRTEWGEMRSITHPEAHKLITL